MKKIFKFVKSCLSSKNWKQNLNISKLISESFKSLFREESEIRPSAPHAF